MLEYQITIDDGQGETVAHTTSEGCLGEMVRAVLLETVLASAEIEGEELPPGSIEVDDLPKPPRKLLTTR